MMTTDMLNKVSETIEKYNMINRGESVLCCLSGGADSVALLLCLHKLGADVKACHVNHLLRGDESMRDESFCVSLCEKFGVPLEVKRVDAKMFSQQGGYSFEEGARVLRYKIFSEQGCDKIATAHTLSDCLETAVFNLARGTGLTGLASIPPVRDNNIIRPLINCSRSEIVDFLVECGQDYVTDSTNLTDEYTRNRIRHNIVPQMKNMNPSLEKTFLGTLENLREDNAFILRQANKLQAFAKTSYGYKCEPLIQSDPAVSGRVIAAVLSEKGVSASRERILEVRELCRNGGKITVGKNVYLCSDKYMLYYESDTLGNFCFSAKIDEKMSIGCKTVCLEKKQPYSLNIHDNLTSFCADYDKIKGDILVRSRVSGDNITLIGREFTSSVKKIVQSAFKPHERKNAIILADNDGVIFVEKYGFADRVKADADTKSYLICKIS